MLSRAMKTILLDNSGIHSKYVDNSGGGSVSTSRELQVVSLEIWGILSLLLKK